MRLTLFALPVTVFAIHALVFGTWINDDAGITFAYARNLAAGHGLVAQPHSPPVEGYSNPLWVAVLAIFFALGAFHVVWTPKLLSLVLVAGAFALLQREQERMMPPGAAVVAPILVALQPGFVIWSVSGLENPLYVLLLALLMVNALRVLMAADTSPWLHASTGVLACAIALTRPDGLVYALAHPIVLLAASLRERGAMRNTEGRLPSFGLYWVSFGTPFAAFLLFRWLYFGDLLPNTYYAKGGPTLDTVWSLLRPRTPTIERVLDLAGAIVGTTTGLAAWLLAALLGSVFFLAGRRCLHPVHVVHGVLAVLSATTFLLLPPDWMPEFRFATPFFLFCYAALVAICWSVCGAIAPPILQRRMFILITGILIAGTVVLAANRSTKFASAPTVPLASVAERFAHRYNRIAAMFGVGPAGSLLVPDVGGTLLHSNLRIFDLGMLCDKTIARTLDKNPAAFYEYVFETVRPTFIHVHGEWTRRANLDADARFRTDYVPLYEYVDESLLQRRGLRLYSGDFVRKELAVSHLDALQRVQIELRQAADHR